MTEMRTRRIKIWGRWMRNSPSYMTTEYNPDTKKWDLIDMPINSRLWEVKMNHSGKMLALVAFMNLGLYLIVRLWVLPTAQIGSLWWYNFAVFGFAFQLNWVMLMVSAFWVWFGVREEQRE